jgi:general secretion pathway protein G
MSQSVRINRRGAARAFTLIEMMAVVVIIGMLVGTAFLTIPGMIEKGRVSAAKTQIDALDQALIMFNVDVGRYPTEEEGLDALLVAPADNTGWNGPYLGKSAIPPDPWNQPYHYAVRTTDQGTECIVYSYGSDKVKGGTPKTPAADIVSRGASLDDWAQ